MANEKQTSRQTTAVLNNGEGVVGTAKVRIKRNLRKHSNNWGKAYSRSLAGVSFAAAVLHL